MSTAFFAVNLKSVMVPSDNPFAYPSQPIGKVLLVSEPEMKSSVCVLGPIWRGLEAS